MVYKIEDIVLDNSILNIYTEIYHLNGSSGGFTVYDKKYMNIQHYNLYDYYKNTNTNTGTLLEVSTYCGKLDDVKNICETISNILDYIYFIKECTYMAIYLRNLEIFKYLYELIHINLPCNDVIRYALFFNRFQIIKYLYELPIEYGITIETLYINQAIRYSDINLVKLLCEFSQERGMYIDFNILLTEAAKYNKPDILKYLISLPQVNVEAITKDYITEYTKKDEFRESVNEIYNIIQKSISNV